MGDDLGPTVAELVNVIEVVMPSSTSGRLRAAKAMLNASVGVVCRIRWST